MRHFLDRDDITALFLVNRHHLFETAGTGMDQHVRQKEGKRLITNDLTGAPDSMAQPQGFLLAGEAGLAGGRALGFEQFQLIGLAALAQGFLKLVLLVEVILDDALVAAGDKDEMLDAGLTGLVDSKLDHRAIDHRQHLLRHCLGCGQESGAQSGNRENGLVDLALHFCPLGHVLRVAGGYGRHNRQKRFIC